MKKMFFALLMTSSTLLCALPPESISDLEHVLQPFNELEARCPRRHKRCHEESSADVENCQNVVSIAYGSFYTLSTFTPQIALNTEENQTKKGIKKQPAVIEVIVAPGSPIIFDQTSVTKDNVKLRNDGQILVTEPGDYVVNFGVAGFSFEPLQFALVLNGRIQPSSTISGPADGELTSASTILHIPVASAGNPSILSVINNGQEDLTLDGSVENSVAAFINIESLRRLNQTP